jgi:hypothetical protein
MVSARQWPHLRLGAVEIRVQALLQVPVRLLDAALLQVKVLGARSHKASKQSVSHVQLHAASMSHSHLEHLEVVAVAALVDGLDGVARLAEEGAAVRRVVALPAVRCSRHNLKCQPNKGLIRALLTPESRTSFGVAVARGWHVVLHLLRRGREAARPQRRPHCALEASTQQLSGQHCSSMMGERAVSDFEVTSAHVFAFRFCQIVWTT